ncbi:MAG: insulinase family protein [Prevotellaceae bacterium]|jgi:predicted Zn-dependent peptidase|nr:insulinase family protein [Prevotellaceae bacterium]
MKKTTFLLFAVLGAMLCTSCGNGYHYETVPNDPTNTRIYTLDNGLKVYLTVNKSEPRIQTYIPVRVGGKNDPQETTGLSHYLEHLLFKGTGDFGTKDYAAEKPLLDQIEALYETYRATTGDAERKAIYKQIDSVSQEASKFAIPNEYDKMMSHIGAEGTNAFTSFDVTNYVENIPSNQLETWAKIEADRFKNPVIRLFHTELETVYEEKNRSLANDSRKAYEALLAALFPHHTYGTQTVLGTQEHLKNPSIVNIKNHYNSYYVANNMAVILSGDFDPDQAIKIIDKYFSSLPSGEVPAFVMAEETPVTAPIVKEVLGNDAENVTVGFRFPGANSPEAEMLEILDYLMNNGKAGLLDLNVNQKQRVLSASAGVYDMADYQVYVLSGRPKQGQTLEQVKDILLEQIELLKKGEFEDWLIEATINNFKLNEIHGIQSNQVRVRQLMDAFVNKTPWENVVNKLDRQSKLTKQQIVDFANTHFGNNYAVVYKRQGEDPDIKKIDKPAITPIAANRDDESEYLQKIKAIQVTPIEPVFLDYEKDLQQTTLNGLPVLYKQNTENNTFELTYLLEMGSNSDKALGTAFSYLNYLGTSKYTPEQIKSEFYKLACSFDVSSSAERVYVSLSGLDENFEKALDLLEDLLADPQVNKEAFDNLRKDIIKSRANAKLNQGRIINMLYNYAVWGQKSSATNILSNKELAALKPGDLIKRIKAINGYEHKILYYGPKTQDKLVQILNALHRMPDTFQPLLPATKFTQVETPANKVLYTHYDSPQLNMVMHSKGIPYAKELEPIRRMYNEYFSGGMNAIVFQEMREARSLAYSAQASYSGVSKPELNYIMFTFIGTQNDKLTDAVGAFKDILNNLPESEKAFNIAKEAITASIRTERIIRESVLWNYLDAQKFGYTYDRRKDVFEQTPQFTLQDVKAFQEKYVKGLPYVYCILGDKKALSIDTMKNIAPVQTLTLEEIFGY